MLIFDILTIFPEAFDSYFNQSILKRAKKEKFIQINLHNLRDYTLDKYKTVDDRPYGGGPGMILKIEPIFKALRALKVLEIKEKKIIHSSRTKIILLDPRGKALNQRMAEELSKLDQLVLICGHYEGVDARVEKLVDFKISIGDYVLTGGEIPAMVIVDAITRLIPGVLKNVNSLKEETFSSFEKEYPQYTRPEIFSINEKIKWRVPKILLSGNHQKIAQWRENRIKSYKR